MKMKIPEEIIEGVKKKQAAIGELKEKKMSAARESDKIEQTYREALKPKGSGAILVPLCFGIARITGIWLEFLGGKRKRFETLENDLKNARAEAWKCFEWESAAERELDSYIGEFLKSIDPRYKMIADDLKEMEEIYMIANAFYELATRVRCDMIGFLDKKELEKARAAGAGEIRPALAKFKEDLKPYERSLFLKMDHPFMAGYSENFSGLYRWLQACSLDSEDVEDFKRQLDVALNILRQMTNMTRYPDDLEKELSRQIDIAKRICLEDNR